jgi:hypothetical protein
MLISASPALLTVVMSKWLYPMYTIEGFTVLMHQHGRNDAQLLPRRFVEPSDCLNPFIGCKSCAVYDT